MSKSKKILIWKEWRGIDNSGQEGTKGFEPYQFCPGLPLVAVRALLFLLMFFLFVCLFVFASPS